MSRATRYYNWLIVKSDQDKHELLKAAYPDWERKLNYDASDYELRNTPELIIYAELLDSLAYGQKNGWLGFEIAPCKTSVEILLTDNKNTNVNYISYEITKRGIRIKLQSRVQSIPLFLERQLGSYRSNLLDRWVKNNVQFDQLQDYQQELETKIERQIGGGLGPLHLILNQR